FRLAVLSQAFLGVLSFALPHTPPPARGQPFSAREALGVDALVLLKQPSYLVFMVSSFLVCIPLAFYYQLAQNGLDAGGIVDIAQTMAYGQVSEIFFMVVMPFFLVRLGVKWMLAIGMLAWAVRYLLFAFGVPDGVFWMLYGGVILHGICYDFFFVTGQLYTDRVAPARIRGQAQGMLVLFTLGLGMLIGAQVAGQVEKRFSPPAEEKMALTDGASALATEIAALVKTRQESQVAVPGIDERIDQLRAERRGLLLQTVDWKALWLVPAIGAAVVLVLFSLTFKDRIRRDDLVSKSIEKKPDEDGGEA
ncbi:MAG TPA: MFS transporter, partial [Planctomycetota bacterium]|nr:MFS transporter [Planctomycetota bacterium]